MSMSTFTIMLLGLAFVGIVLYTVAIIQERHKPKHK